METCGARPRARRDCARPRGDFRADVAASASRSRRFIRRRRPRRASHRHGQEKVHPVAAAAEGRAAHPGESAPARQPQCPERPHGDHDEAGQQDRDQLHSEARSHPAGRTGPVTSMCTMLADLTGHEPVGVSARPARRRRCRRAARCAAQRIVAGDVTRSRRSPPRRPRNGEEALRTDEVDRYTAAA